MVFFKDFSLSMLKKDMAKSILRRDNDIKIAKEKKQKNINICKQLYGCAK